MISNVAQIIGPKTGEMILIWLQKLFFSDGLAQP